MSTAELLALAALLEKYVPHAHGRGYHAAAGWAVELRDIAITEAKMMEHSAAEKI